MEIKHMIVPWNLNTISQRQESLLLEKESIKV